MRLDRCDEDETKTTAAEGGAAICRGGGFQRGLTTLLGALRFHSGSAVVACALLSALPYRCGATMLLTAGTDGFHTPHACWSETSAADRCRRILRRFQQSICIYPSPSRFIFDSRAMQYLRPTTIGTYTPHR